jgi:hypothetical protein
MIDHTFAVPGLATGGGPYVRAVVDAAFALPGVHAVGIDWSGATLTVTSSRPIPAAELSAAIDAAGPHRPFPPGAADVVRAIGTVGPQRAGPSPNGAGPDLRCSARCAPPALSPTLDPETNEDRSP